MGLSHLNTILSLFLSAFAGPGNDLLDFASTASYWRIQATEPTFENLAASIEPVSPPAMTEAVNAFAAAGPRERELLGAAIVRQGDAALPELRALVAGNDTPTEVARGARRLMDEVDARPRVRSIRRLLAIRTLGEHKEAKSLPLLQALLKSTEPFVADYAAAAIARIEDRPAPRVMANIANDVWLLPARCAVVGQMRAAPGIVAPLDDLLRSAVPAGAAEARADALTVAVLGIAESFGNVRWDGLTLGASADLGDRSGFLVCIVRGRYHRARLIATLTAGGIPSREVAKQRVFFPGGDAALFMPWDDELVFLAAPEQKDLPVAAMVEAVKTGGGAIKGEPEMIRLIRSAAADHPAWAAARVAGENRQLPYLSGIDALYASVSQPADNAASIQIEGRGGDVTARATEWRQLIAAWRIGKPPEGGMLARWTGTVEPLLKSARVSTAGSGTVVTATLPLSRRELVTGGIDALLPPKDATEPADPAPVETGGPIHPPK